MSLNILRGFVNHLSKKKEPNNLSAPPNLSPIVLSGPRSSDNPVRVLSTNPVTT